MSFPLQDKIMGGYPIKMIYKIHFRQDSKSHIFSLRMELPFQLILNFSECTLPNLSPLELEFQVEYQT